MPSPTTSLATLRPELGSFMQFDLAGSQMGFIASKVLPLLTVAKQSGSFGKLSIADMLNETDTKRAPGGKYNRDHFEFDDDSYACLEYGSEEPVDDREAEMYSDYFDAEKLAALRARDRVLRAYERRVASAVFNATTFTSYTGGVTSEWDENHYSDATPIADVEAAVQSLYGQGIAANCLIVTWTTFRHLRQMDDITAVIAASGAGGPIEPSKITPQKLAEVFDLDYVLVGNAQYNSAKKGQTASLAKVWDDEYAMVCRIPVTNDIREPCLGRTFHWVADGSSADATVESYRDETVRSEIIRARFDVDEKILHVPAGYLLSNITTP